MDEQEQDGTEWVLYGSHPDYQGGVKIQLAAGTREQCEQTMALRSFPVWAQLTIEPVQV